MLAKIATNTLKKCLTAALILLLASGLSACNIIGKIISSTQSHETPLELPPYTAYRGEWKTLSIAEVQDLRQLLLEQKFAELNQKLEAYQQAYAADPSEEFRANGVFAAFELKDPKWSKYFVAWRRESPEFYQAHLASAYHYHARAWSERGTRYMSKTSDAQRRGFVRWSEKSVSSLKAALALNEDVLAARILLHLMLRNSDDNELIDLKTQESLAKFPDAYSLRYTIMVSLQPRWGGSHTAMHRFAVDSVNSSSNAMMPLLLGSVDDDKAHYYEADKKYSLALKHSNSALAFGDHPNWFKRRSKIYLQQLDGEKALQNALKFGELNYRIDSAAYTLQSRAYLMLNDLEKAEQAYQRASELDSDKYSVDEWPSWASNYLNRYASAIYKTDKNLAVKYYDDALVLEPDSSFSGYWRGMTLRALGDFKAAEKAFETVISADANYIEAYRAIDALLLAQGRTAQIIPYWDNYLALNPDDAEALMERSGTYFHLGERDKSKTDLSRACDLSLEKACQTLKRYFGAESIAQS